MENKLFVLLGPTGVGKTETALRIAEMLGTPIINADSRQIYKDIPIGTAAPTAEQMQRVRHYFVGMLALDEYYSAAEYERQVWELLPTLYETKPYALLTGGSMLYIDAVCHGIDDIPTVEDETRTMMRQRLKDEGLERLCAELRLLDPTYYAQADLRNTQRIVHALEICYQTGKPLSSFWKKESRGENRESGVNLVKIGLYREREDLFDRINRRTLQMLKDGFEEEARNVYPLRHLNSLNTVGYKEMFHYINGEWTLEQAVEKIQRNTRVYAKKQMTWFKRDEDIHWFHANETDKVLEYVKVLLK
ncbi:MAG: tRNA (adenosine(37)-N6)-dimethylallyltransferase MiaA [Bacteroidaceae bacterium]|nr:tRNA (adenosine(37)-N6)-dimethylallyltransferase MiaA [Bacteroidaceae bacterium]